MGLQIGRAISIVLQTWRYMLYRAAVYAALCGFILAWLLLLYLIGDIFGQGAFWALAAISVGLAAMLGLTGFIGEYLFYTLKAGHIALIAEIIAEGRPPRGVSQLKWGKGRILEVFETAAMLPHIRQSLGAIIRNVNRRLFDVEAALPVPYVECGTIFAQRLADLAQNYVEEAALAYSFRTKDETIFYAARSAVLVYCQSWRSVLGNAVALTFIGYCFALLATVIFLIPLGFVASVWDQSIIRFVLFALGVFLAFATKWTLFDPVACASTALAFFEESDLAEPDAEEWEAKVAEVSGTFVELGRKGEEKTGKTHAKRAGRKPRTRRAKPAEGPASEETPAENV